MYRVRTEDMRYMRSHEQSRADSKDTFAGAILARRLLVKTLLKRIKDAMLREVVGRVDRADDAWLEDGGTCVPMNCHRHSSGARRVGRPERGRVGCLLKILLLS